MRLRSRPLIDQPAVPPSALKNKIRSKLEAPIRTEIDLFVTDFAGGLSDFKKLPRGFHKRIEGSEVSDPGRSSCGSKTAANSEPTKLRRRK